MNERRSVIKDSHEETFHWVLKRPSEIQEPEATTVLNKWGKRNYSSLDNSFESCASHQWQKRWPNFIEWLESDETKYWISGKPGSGKSTLVKFLIENPKTATALNQWRDGTEILSHFFWKLGGPAQQNLRGFWFSLAHQRLLNNPNILQNILSNSVTARTKDEPSDWSDKELRAICLEILGQGSQPLCIFLDGLDEIADSDGSSKVIGAIDDIIKTLAPNIKTCFSCRLENRFKIRLAGVPELKIHDLTRRDMWWMIRSEISRFCSSLPVHTEQVEVLREKIEAALIEKAAGVFIWLVLALKTLQPGFENGDSESELLSRVEGLPSGIENLYEDMWSRLGVSESTYKEKGSEYLNLMVISMKLRDDYPNMEKDARKPLLLGQIAIAADPVLRTRFNSTSGDFGRSILLQECKKTQQAIENRTSGLLEVMDNSDTGRVYGIPGDVPGKHVTFIHRTAYDYLTTTSHGSEILATSPVSPCHTHIHLACGILGLDPFIGNFPDFNLRQALFHLDQAASYGSESSLQSKVLSYCFKLCTEKVEGDKERFNPDGGRVITARLFNGPLATTTFISTILEFRCCEPWFTQIAQERDRTPDFLSSLLYEFLMRVGEKIQDIDSSNANAQTLDALDSKVRHCCRTIQWLISLGASVHFVDESITTMSTLNTWLAKFASFSIHFLSVKHVNHVKYGWNLGILASLIKATEEPASTILIQGQFFKDHHPMLEASFCRLDDNPYCLNDHEHMPKPGKHVNLCDALPIKFDIKVSLGFCVSIFLGFEMENMESNVSELNILREFCNQVSKETLETPESVCVTVHEDFSSSQAGFCVLRNPHLDRPARAAWFWGRLEWLILLSYTGYPRNMSIAQEDQDAFIRGLKKLQENDAL